MGSWPCFHFCVFGCGTERGWRTFPSFFLFCSQPGSGVSVHMEVSNERHRERGRTAGSLEGSTPKAETTEELRVRNDCGGSRKKRESWPDGQRANPQRSPGRKQGLGKKSRWKMINI